MHALWALVRLEGVLPNTARCPVKLFTPQAIWVLTCTFAHLCRNFIPWPAMTPHRAARRLQGRQAGGHCMALRPDTIRREAADLVRCAGARQKVDKRAGLPGMMLVQSLDPAPVHRVQGWRLPCDLDRKQVVISAGVPAVHPYNCNVRLFAFLRTVKQMSPACVHKTSPLHLPLVA